ncbi:hypothetical protein CfE428DRAFT_2732 [Chthoniobacter flavus Ellin428]|uniref:GYF domain-containing protein n=1 Tax=Chthoniobacter flavus Ellin428 TaxID=497964 RepID=B4D1E4_9BACT|nr:GYF domain-containing protein [Chthoniobacter flavus]EDY19556.1 hypothetical protein CfE428DRAFT_2732 [Chthoniobacter flavus Ellin428]TCO92800.1 uncharacterized protein DUF4339 [Chthoniobacter flavus]
MNYYYSLDGKNVEGPKSLEELTALFSQGVSWNTQVCAEGSKTWQPLSAACPPQGGGSVPPPPPPIPQTGDSTGGLIPYKNPQALVAYYLGIFGLCPFIGPLLAIPAIILGILGLKKRKLNPIIKGAVHAWIGIILGAVSLAYHVLIVLAIVGSSHH